MFSYCSLRRDQGNYTAANGVSAISRPESSLGGTTPLKKKHRVSGAFERWAVLGSNQSDCVAAPDGSTANSRGLQEEQTPGAESRDSDEQVSAGPAVDSTGTDLPLIHEGQLRLDGLGEGDGCSS